MKTVLATRAPLALIEETDHDGAPRYHVQAPGRHAYRVYRTRAEAEQEMDTTLREGWYEYRFTRKVLSQHVTFTVTPVGVSWSKGTSLHYMAALHPGGNLMARSGGGYTCHESSRITRLRMVAAQYRYMLRGSTPGRVTPRTATREWRESREMERQFRELQPIAA